MQYWKEHINYRQEQSPTGPRYLIHIDGADVEVEPDVYKAYTQMERRERYLAERESGLVLSLDQLQEDDMQLAFLARSQAASAEDVAVEQEAERERSALIRAFPQALAMLAEEDRALIQAIFLDGISIREYARKQSVPTMTLHYRLERAMKKLKKILN